MHETLVAQLLVLAEPMAALSIDHLTPLTRRKLADNELSVHAYLNEYGGFVHVGDSAEIAPTESDLATIFDLARRARLVWLKFDADAGVLDGLPTYRETDFAS
jgi:hypothetical protein